MYNAQSLENLAKIMHADKQQSFMQASFVRQVEQAQATSLSTHAWQALALSRCLTVHQWVVTFVIRPMRLVLQLT